MLDRYRNENKSLFAVYQSCIYVHFDAREHNIHIYTALLATPHSGVEATVTVKPFAAR